MVTKLILEAFAVLYSFMVGLVPTVTLPTFVTDVMTYIGNGLGVVNDFAWIFPINELKQVTVFLLLVTAVAWGVRLVRLAIGYIPTMGGSQQ